jgi:hypothetical protein
MYVWLFCNLTRLAIVFTTVSYQPVREIDRQGLNVVVDGI